MKQLKDKKIGYGKLMKDMKAEDFNFFGKDALEFASGIVYKEEDVKSAVEWLKEELKKRDDRLQYNKKWVYKLIDEAFEDVLK